MQSLPFLTAVLLGGSLLITACSESPTASQTSVTGNSQNQPGEEIQAPAGNYKLDPNHASLSVSVTHLGLSNYVMWFTDFDIQVALDPADLSKSSVTASINPTSITTDYSGDYKATHEDSPYASWEEDLAQSPKFLNASKFPKASFRSTKVEATGPASAKIHGELTLLGQTQPLVLDAAVSGSAEKHPFRPVGAIGFSATGQFERSAFGMNHLLQPLLVGDKVTVRFEGEFQQVVEPAG